MVKPRKILEPLIFFRDETRETFRFLLTDYGMKEDGVTQAGYEASVHFSNEYMGIVVNHEGLGGVWVAVHAYYTAANGQASYRSAYLDGLMKTRCPEKIIEQDYLKRRSTNEEVIGLVRHFATVLQEDFKDVLSGDFTRFPLLLLPAPKRRKRLP